MLLLRTRRRTYVPAGDWPALHEALIQGEIDIRFIIGRVALCDPNGNELTVEDRFEPFVHELCLEAPIRLMRGEDYAFRNWDFPGEIALHHDGERIRIDTDSSAISACFVKQTLIAALLDCAEQTIDLMQKLLAFDASYPYSVRRYAQELGEVGRSYVAAYGSNDG